MRGLETGAEVRVPTAGASCGCVASGSGLRYSFDIKHKAKTYEVGVDAQTGAVLENAPEGKNPD